MNPVTEFTKGIVRENPVFALLLGLCPVLAVTTGLSNAIGMGLAATFVLFCSNLLISLVKSTIPAQIRIPVFITVIATFVTVVKLVMAGYFPDLKASLGIFLPLIVVNCIILGRAEAYASRHGPGYSIIDALGMGAGFTLALCLIALVREVVGTGQILGIPIARGLDPYTMKIMIIAPGGFLTMGLLLGLFNVIAERHRKAAEIRRAHAGESGA
jgi:electron transport complex protein RnfE